MDKRRWIWWWGYGGVDKLGGRYGGVDRRVADMKCYRWGNWLPPALVGGDGIYRQVGASMD